MSKAIFQRPPHRKCVFFPPTRNRDISPPVCHRMNISALTREVLFMDPTDRTGDVDDLIFADEDYQPSTR